MKALYIALSIILFTGIQSQASIHCIGKNSGTVIAENHVDLALHDKFKLFEINLSTAYLTRKDNDFYSLEMFMPSQEQRVYSEGTISKDSALTLAVWTRDELYEINCSE